MAKKLKSIFCQLEIFLISVFLILISMKNNEVSAQGSPGAGGSPGSITLENPLGQGSTFITIINNVLNFLIYISAPILALMVLIGGFQILTAQADPEKVNNGKKTIIYAAIGFAIILISKGVALILLKIIGS